MIHEIPEPGFYYHYKHDPNGEISKYAYEVLGMTRDTETEEYGVLYRPLYENPFLGSANYFVRPLEMFMQRVTINGEEMPRFTRITDSDHITQLEVIRDKMYGTKV